MSIITNTFISDNCSYPKFVYALPFFRTLFTHWNTVNYKPCYSHDIRFKHQAYSWLATNLMFGRDLLFTLFKYVKGYPWWEMPAVLIEGLFMDFIIWVAVMLGSYPAWLKQKRINRNYS